MIAESDHSVVEHQNGACRYEDEEDADVCEAMERMAQLFLSDSGKMEEVTNESDLSNNAFSQNGFTTDQ